MDNYQMIYLSKAKDDNSIRKAFLKAKVVTRKEKRKKYLNQKYKYMYSHYY